MKDERGSAPGDAVLYDHPLLAVLLIHGVYSFFLVLHSDVICAACMNDKGSKR